MKSIRGRHVLVTGGAGFIGSYVVERLAESGAERVVVVDNLFLGKKSNLDRARTIIGDKLVCYWETAKDSARMATILKENAVEVVYDMATAPLVHSLTDPAGNVRENVELAVVLCELAREKRFETLVRFSSSEAYGTAHRPAMDEEHPPNPRTPYASSKLAGDALVLSYAMTFGVDTRVLRPFNNYGPRQNAGSYAGILPIVVSRVRAGLPIEIHGDGQQMRDLIFVRDTARAAIDIYECEAARDRVVNVASGVGTTVNDLVRELLIALEVPNHPVEHVPARAGDVRRHTGGIALAHELWGYLPNVKLKDGLAETVAWYREQP